MVPDLYGGNSWKDEWDKSGYEAWRLSLDPAWVDNAVRAAAQELRRAYGVAKIGLLGFCFGGGRALEETTKAREDVAPKAAVAFYPTSVLHLR